MKQKLVNIYAGGGGRFLSRLSAGFTMAEILLSLTIIGVVAAITLPSLTGNINERTWNTQRKALYARFSQAIALMPSLNGYGAGNVNAAETFVTDGLAKVLKINNICDAEHIYECGIASKFTRFDATTLASIPKTLYDFNEKFDTSNVEATSRGYTMANILNTNAAAFETQNGESVLVYYNPSCIYDMAYDNVAYHHMQIDMCANFIYDLNGSKGPNTVGKDIGFMAAVYPSDSVVTSVVPAGYANPDRGTQHKVSKNCENTYSGTRAPNVEEAMTIFYNKNLIGNIKDGVTWTTGVTPKGLAYVFMPSRGLMEHWNSRDAAYLNYCIKRPN